MPFSFFSSKSKESSIRDLVWADKMAKDHGALKLLQENPQAIVAGWFNETIQQFQELFNSKNLSVTVRNARQMVSPQVENQTIIFLEHYPLKSKEIQLWQQWKPKSLMVVNSLDEPLFTYFGGERITDLLKKLGMAENESIEHTMISKSIRNAQEKLDKKVITEHSATSAGDWFKRNLPSQ